MNLPYVRVVRPPEVAAAVSAPRLEELVDAVWAGAACRPKVLVATPDDALRDECRRLLVRALFTVVEPPDGGLSPDVIFALLPDVVLADVRTLEGWTEVRRLRDAPISRRLPVIGLSEGQREPDRMWARRLRLACLVPVPLAAEGLVEVVERVAEARE